ncbi:FecCD family ABC transporter permease [Roseibium sp.]|uniref:FecCD family ABC transporter permease n=1 Tax=Roseibium sp. TaxID=1936156 RepID=UPI003B50AB00
MKRQLLLVFLLFVTAFLSLTFGQTSVSLAAIWDGLTGGDGVGALTVQLLRGPRVATALLVGAAFGLSGAIFQSLLRNPLASPDVMGFSAGSGLAILASMTVNLAIPMPAIASAGGLLTAIFILILARPPGGRSSLEGAPAVTIVLVGIGIGFTAVAISSFLMTRLSGPQATEAHRWLAGSLAARDWSHVLQLVIIGGGLVFLLLLQIRSLRLLELGAELATGLGVNVRRARLGLATTALLIAAAAVAIAGPIAFVALMAPPLGARIAQTVDAGGRLLAAALTGAIIVALADLAARASLPGLQLPIGVMTGILGAPYLLWLLSREIERGEL